MIIFDLACCQGHRFEGWFDSKDEFDRQRGLDLVRCPMCDVASVARIPSARIGTAKAEAPAPVAVATDAPTTNAVSTDAIAGIPAEVIAKLREIVQNTENVGRRFPEEARKIHYEEAPARAIRGQASAEEAQSLRDEGIDFASLPPIFTDPTH
ncbi:MAG TPA: DUF1178 family protein [Casimicrobiaceae bacterium]|nr:DUF1178 family protein [Casimicrobiaceae bacterium]